MTEGFAMNGSDLPAYNTALGKFLMLPDKLDQTYTGVLTQIYPLRADINALEKFCQDNLNLSGAPVRFEPVAPWVLVQVCDYQKMALASENIGWVSQHELAFGFPIKWYLNDKLLDWAMFYPFIFVDNPLSMSAGRQIYGWSKAAIEIDRLLPELDPGSPHCLASISAPIMTVFPTFTLALAPNLSSGSAVEDTRSCEPFIRILQQRPFLSGMSGVTGFVGAVPKAIAGYFSLAGGLLEAGGRMISGYTYSNLQMLGRDVQSLGEVLVKVFGYANSIIPGALGVVTGNQPPSGADVPVKIITLKQIRDAETTADACYQAVVGSSMTVNKILDAGALFDPLSGNPSGGIEVRLSESHQPSIVDALGLVGAKDVNTDEGVFFSFSPTLPYWAKMNLSYGSPDFQCWRTLHTDWQVSPVAYSPTPRVITPLEPLKYRLGGSGPSQELGGSRTYCKAILRILAFKTQTAVLSSLVKQYLENSHYDFDVPDAPGSPGKSFVYVFVSTYDAGWVDGAKIKGDRTLTFAALVDYYLKNNPESKLPGYVPLYSFVGQDWNFITDGEMYGQVTFSSVLKSPDDPWIESLQSSPGDRHKVLEVSTLLFPKGEATPQQAQKTPLINIYSSLPSGGTLQAIASLKRAEATPAGKPVASGPVLPTEDLIAELGLQKYLSPVSTSDVALTRDFYCIALKQVCDGINIRQAGYQALVGVNRRVGYVRLFPLPSTQIGIVTLKSLPILETLGLSTAGHGSEQFIDADVATVGTCSIADKPAKNLCWRTSVSGEWMMERNVFTESSSTR
jgi:hypothetical protein